MVLVVLAVAVPVVALVLLALVTFTLYRSTRMLLSSVKAAGARVQEGTERLAELQAAGPLGQRGR